MPHYSRIAVAVVVVIVAGCTSRRASPPSAAGPTAITQPTAATQPSDLYGREFIGELVSLSQGRKRIATWHVDLRDRASGQVVTIELLPRDPFFREGLGLETFEAIQEFQRTQHFPLHRPLFRVRIGAPQGVRGGKGFQWERLPSGA